MSGLDQFLEIGKLIEEVNILGKTVTLKVLSAGELQEVFDSVPSAGDDISKNSKIMSETLARAIIGVGGMKINYKNAQGEPLTREKTIQENIKILQTLSFPAINEFWAAYQRLTEKQQQKIDELKKVQTSSGQEISGESQKPSVLKKSFPSTP